MITIYHLESSRSERIVWLMEELGLPYDLQIFPRSPNGAAPDALKAMQPLGRAPLIRDGDMVLLNGFVKKTQKTPPQEIELALRRMKELT